jgi:hypothetical protein
MHEHPHTTAELAGRTTIGKVASAAFAVAVALVVAACSGSAASPAASAAGASPAAASPAAGAESGDVCANVAALRTSIDELKAVDVVTVGTAGLQAAVDKVRTAGTAVKETAGSEIGPSVDALMASLDGLKTAVDGVGEASVAGESAIAIRAAVAEVGTSATALTTQIQAGPCPS